MRRRLPAALLAVVAGGPALALSCMPADPARTFQRADADAARYSVLLGTFDFAPLDRPRGAFAPNADEQTRRARFSGQALGNGGFAPTSDREVRLAFSCTGQWCGTLDPGTRLLAFARHGTGGLTVTLGPCDSWIFEDPDQTVIETVETCMAGGPCEAAPLR
jgi:hypothetical protein